MLKTHQKVLAGDIGGTKTSLAVFEAKGDKLKLVVHESYPSRQYSSLDEIIREFFSANKFSCELAGFGIAGPVRDGKCKTTNLPWLVDAQQLASQMGLAKVCLMNDLEANAWGISALEGKDFYVLNKGRPIPGGNASIISAGTGLGQAGLIWDGRGYIPFASEGGHADFAPQSDLEIALLQYLKQKYHHVSWERVVSGMGLVNLYDFLCEHRQSETLSWLAAEMKAGDPAAVISKAAQANRCSVCVESLELFSHLYGAEVGNHALKIMATGGVYIGGGIAPKILGKLKEQTFMQAFYSKGRMEPLLRDMPVKVILNELTALYGPAVFAVRDI